MTETLYNPDDAPEQIDELNEIGHGQIIDYRLDDDGQVTKTAWMPEDSRVVNIWDHETDEEKIVEEPYEGYELDTYL